MPLAPQSKRSRTDAGPRSSLSAPNRSYLERRETPQSTEILSTLKNKIVESLSYSPFSQQDRNAYQKARLDVQEVKLRYLAYHNPGKPTKELEHLPHPEVFSQVAAEAREEAGRRQKNKKIELVLTNRPSTRRADLLEKSDEEIDRLAAPCIEESSLVRNVNDRFDRLMDSSGLRQPPHNYRLQAERRNSQEFFINTNGNVAVSYGVFDEFKAIGIEQKLQSYAGISSNIEQANYDMENDFFPNVSELKELSSHLKTTEQMIEEVAHILTELLRTSKDEDTEDMSRYIRIGQKPAFELAESGVGLSDQAHDYFAFVAEPADPVPLFTTISINLETHPRRDQVRDQIEQIYRDCGLKDTYGRDKTFIKGDPYRSNLSSSQLREVAPSLSAMIKAKRLQEIKNESILNRVVNSSRRLLRSSTAPVPSPLEILRDHDISNLLEIAKRIDPDCCENSTLSEKTLPYTKNLCDTFPGLTQRISNVLDQILEFFSISNVEPLSKLPVLTRQHKIALYQSKLPLAIDNDEKTRPEIIERQVDELFVTLKTSKAYRHAREKAPALQEVVDGLQQEFRSRLSGRSGVRSYKDLEPRGFYGQDMIRRAVSSLEAYIGKIYFARDLKISGESIERSFNMLAGQVGSEMTTHCATGFAGRVEEPLTALVSDADDLISQGVRNFKLQCIEEAFRDVYAHSSESAMSIQAKSDLMKELGLSDSDQGTSTKTNSSYLNSFNDVSRLRVKFNEKYQPTKIYQSVLKHVSDAFVQAAGEGDDGEVRKILSTLKFDAGAGDIHHQFKEFRINQDPAAPWQPAFFQHDVPAKLVGALMEKSIILKKPDHMRETADYREVEQQQASAIPTQYSAAGKSVVHEV